MPSSPNQQEQIDVRILRLIGLEDVFDLDYGTYLSLLKEVMVKGRMAKTSIPTEEIELVTEEFKRVKSKKDKGRFKVKAKKISASTLGKNITGVSAKIASTKVKGLLPGKGVATLKPAETEDVLSSIQKTLDSILNLLLGQQKSIKAALEKQRRTDEQNRRKATEERLEKGLKAVVKVANKILAPVKSILDRIIGFFVAIFLGRVVNQLLAWFADPKNSKKISSIFRFLKDHWPKLLGFYILFGTKFGKFVRTISKFLIRGIVGFASKNPKIAAIIGAGVLTKLAFDYVSDLLKKVSGEGSATSISDQSSGLAGFYGGGPVNVIQVLNTGGFVSGQKGIDKIPAMLTDGEFVMSRGAVQKFGLDTLLAMNSAGGGTNRPRMVRGVPYAQGGGYISRDNNTSAIAPIRAGMTAVTKPLQGIRGSGLGGTAQLGFHGTSAGAAERILAPVSDIYTRQQGIAGFRPGSAQNIYMQRGTFFAPSAGSMSRQGIIPQAAQEFMQRGGDVQRGALQRAFGAKSTGPGSLIPGIYPQGATPFEMNIPGTKYAESLFRSKDADRYAQFGQRVMSGKYSRSTKAAQLLKTGSTTARLTGAKAAGRTLGRFIPFANVGLGAADVAIRASQGDYVGAGLGGLSIVPGPIGWTALGAQMLYDAGRSGALNTKPSSNTNWNKRLEARRGKRRPAMRFAGGPTTTTPKRTYDISKPMSQGRTKVVYMNTPSGGNSGGGYSMPVGQDVPSISAVSSSHRRFAKASQLGIG